MTAQGYKYLSQPSAHTVGILLITRRISTSLSRIAIHKGLSARCDSTRASRTYTIIFVSWALCGLIVEFIVFHYMIFALGINTICFKSDSCLYSTSRQATLLYSSTIPQGCYSQNSGPIPLLFSIYINDLANVCTSSFPILFADDTNLFNHGKDMFSLQVALNQELANISKWLKVNKLSLNIKKTMYMIFSRKKKHDLWM